MDMAIYWYIYALPPFFIQLVIGEALFSYRLKRRPLFWLRLGIGLFISVGFLYFAALAIIACMQVNFVLVSLMYIIIFMFTVGVMAVCFDESFFTLMFCAVAAYAMQNLSYRILNIIELLGGVGKLSGYIGYWPAYFSLFFITFALVAVSVYFIFVRRMNNADIAHVHSGKVLAISMTALVITVVLCTWTNSYIWQSFDLSFVSYLFSCVSCVFILCLQSGMLQTERLKQDLVVIKQLWEQDRKQYDVSRENINLINIKCHDLRFRIHSLRTTEGEISKDELKEIENAISIYDSKISTGCEPLDTILTEMSLFCNKNGIKLSCMADGSKLSFISPSDLYSLFGNIISNAVEAVCKVESKERRLISFQVRQVGGMLLIATENYFDGALIIKNGAVVTSKEDKLNHGYGLKSIQMLVKKYGGDMDVGTNDNVFSLKLLFPLAS